MKKTIVLILLLIPMICFAGALQEKQRSVIAKKNVAAGAQTEEWGYTSNAATSFAGQESVLTCIGPFTATHTGSIKKFHLYSSNTDGNADFTVGVYTNSSDAPGSLVGSATEFTNVGTWSLGWKEFSPTTVSVTGSSSYFICFTQNAIAALTYYYNGDLTGTHWVSKGEFTYGTSWPSSFGTPSGNLDGYAVSYKVTVEY
jgi:hypothetical protein